MGCQGTQQYHGRGALPRARQGQVTQIRQEEVAALPVATHAKLTDKVGTYLSVGEPGANHMHNELYDAKLDHVPVAAILGQIQFHMLSTGYFQVVDTHQALQ